MNLDRLYQILSETTLQLRKGEEIEERDVGPVHVTEINAMPHESEAPNLEKVDLELLVVGVHVEAAKNNKDEFIKILRTYPNLDRLAGGPSYIDVGADLGDHGAAFQLFALGKVLGLWNVITPATVGITGSAARDLAGRGFVMISGWRPDA